MVLARQLTALAPLSPNSGQNVRDPYSSLPLKRRAPSLYVTSGWKSRSVQRRAPMSRASERTLCSTAGEDVHSKSSQ